MIENLLLKVFLMIINKKNIVQKQKAIKLVKELGCIFYRLN